MDSNVLVFKTSVETTENIASLKPILDMLAGHGKWNFALDDCDRILRVVGGRLHPNHIIEELTSKGFQCKELEY